MRNSTGIVRRSELHLRGHFPELKTTIYQTEEESFEIYCESPTPEEFEKISQTFLQEIKTITSPVKLSLSPPSTYERVIPTILDSEIPKNLEGIIFTKPSLLSTLQERFPSAPIYKIDDDAGIIEITTATYRIKNGTTTHHIFLNNQDRSDIIKFLDALKLPADYVIKEIDLGEDPNLETYADSEKRRHTMYARPLPKDAFPFTQRDTVLWNDNVDKIFSGTYKKEDLYFYDNKSYSCYVDFTFDTNLNLRNHLLLYQTVFIAPPPRISIDNWLAKQKIHRKEFIELALRKRFKIVLPLQLHLYDARFLHELYEAAPDAVVSQKALAALQQIDIVETANRYIFNDHQAIVALKQLSELISETKPQARLTYGMLVWPIKALRLSFEQLHRSGQFLTTQFGINKVLDIELNKHSSSDVGFEFLVNSSTIHLASSLNATYFPFSTDDGYTNYRPVELMGRLLNFHKTFNTQNITDLMAERKLNSGVKTLDDIDIMTIDDYIPITEFEQLADSDSIFPGGKRLIESLAPLNEQDRAIKIAHYNEQVIKKLNSKSRLKKALDLTSPTGEDLLGAALDFTYVGTGLRLAKLVSVFGRKTRLMKVITRKVEDAINQSSDKANIHFLTKINRIAKLKPRPDWGSR